MLILKSILIFSILCFTPDEHAGKTKETQKVEELKKIIDDENTIVEVTIKVKDKEKVFIYANCVIKKGLLHCQTVRIIDGEYILIAEMTGYSLDRVKSIKIIKKRNHNPKAH